MAKDPEQRFRSARSFARELRQWLDANPVGPEGEALGATVPASAIPTPRRRAPALAVAATLAVMATAAAAIWWQGRAAGPPAPVAGTSATSATKPGVDARPAPPTTATTPSVGLSTSASTQAVASPPVPMATTVPSATVAATAAQPPAPTSLPTGANNPAAQEALLLASIVPMPTLAGARPAEPTRPTAIASVEPPAPALTSAAPPPAKESAKERKAREARERDARERELRLAAAKPAVVATGTVRIAISPWGNVEVDGAASGVAPPLTELTLAEGRHQIVVRNGDYAPHTVSVNVTAGQTISVRHKFGS
jgi:serine/threonine-protein kinase